MLNLIKIGSYIKDIINPKRLYISNYFETSFEKKVLILYITRPFIAGVDIGHSNNTESIEIAKIFHNLGYQVDIAQYNGNFKSMKFQNTEYDVVFGLEPNFLKAVTEFHPRKSIYYATGAHYIFQNHAEKERLLDLEKRRGILLSPKRFVMSHESSKIADAVICIGNKWTASTYKGESKQTECIPVSAYSMFSIKDIQAQKSWMEARKNFLWFGSVGAVHKGLDLLLEIFSRNPNVHLYVCGNVCKEKDFFDAYEKELLHTDNIHLMGWTNPNSENFKKLAITCAFSILPSCSEGMNGAVPTCMHLGLIPLVSKECGLDVENCGTVFENNSIRVIEEIILDHAGKDEQWLLQKSSQSYEFAKKNNTIENFSACFRDALEKIL